MRVGEQHARPRLPLTRDDVAQGLDRRDVPREAPQQAPHRPPAPFRQIPVDAGVDHEHPAIGMGQHVHGQHDGPALVVELGSAGVTQIDEPAQRHRPAGRDRSLPRDRPGRHHLPPRTRAGVGDRRGDFGGLGQGAGDQGQHDGHRILLLPVHHPSPGGWLGPGSDGIHPNMELSWDDLRLFRAAYASGSLSAAATELGIGQATMSRRIAAMEDRIGHVLFDRTRRGLAPTAAAHALRPHVDAMAAGALDAAAAIAALEAEPAGLVRIAAPEGVAVDLLPRLVPPLGRRYPRIRLAILSDNLARDLSLREADLALRSIRPDGGDLLLRRLPDVPLGLYASPALIAALPPDPTLAHVPLLQWSDDMAHIPMARWIAAALGDRPPAHATNSFLAMRALAASSAGAMLVPGFQGRLAGLVEVPVATPPAPVVPWYLVVPRPLRPIPRVAAVVDLLTEAIDAAVATGRWPDLR